MGTEEKRLAVIELSKDLLKDAIIAVAPQVLKCMSVWICLLPANQV
jgi:hypothetical protein